MVNVKVTGFGGTFPAMLACMIVSLKSLSALLFPVEPVFNPATLAAGVRRVVLADDMFGSALNRAIEALVYLVFAQKHFERIAAGVALNGFTCCRLTKCRCAILFNVSYLARLGAKSFLALLPTRLRLEWLVASETNQFYTARLFSVLGSAFMATKDRAISIFSPFLYLDRLAALIALRVNRFMCFFVASNVVVLPAILALFQYLSTPAGAKCCLAFFQKLLFCRVLSSVRVGARTTSHTTTSASTPAVEANIGFLFGHIKTLINVAGRRCLGSLHQTLIRAGTHYIPAPAMQQTA